MTPRQRVLAVAMVFLDLGYPMPRGIDIARFARVEKRYAWAVLRQLRQSGCVTISGGRVWEICLCAEDAAVLLE